MQLLQTLSKFNRGVARRARNFHLAHNPATDASSHKWRIIFRIAPCATFETQKHAMRAPSEHRVAKWNSNF
eukprot:5362949-Pyramimonas_sp.AAC.1